MADKQIRYLNLPKIPDHLLEELRQLSNNQRPEDRLFLTYRWTSANKTKIEEWCNKNISENLIWGLQIITGDLALHIDSPTKVKISYIIDTGGDNVITEFYKDLRSNTLLDAMKIDNQRWHILNVGVPHRVIGIEPGKVRISLTGRIF
jgi:hypothetical protein